MGHSQGQCLEDITAAIHELKKVERNLRDNKFERAEKELADAIEDIAKTLECINQLESDS